MDCEPSLTGGQDSCIVNDSTNDLNVVASHRLTRLARENGFTVHGVPGDGNCLFNAVAYQLESVCASDMRQIVAKYLANNSVFYHDFLSNSLRRNPVTAARHFHYRLNSTCKLLEFNANKCRVMLLPRKRVNSIPSPPIYLS